MKIVIYTTAITGLRRVKSRNRELSDARGKIFNLAPCVDCHIPVVPSSETGL